MIVAKLIALEISHYVVENYFSLHFHKYSSHRNMFQTNAVDYNQNHIYIYNFLGPFSYNHEVLIKSVMFDLSFMKCMGYIEPI